MDAKAEAREANPEAGAVETAWAQRAEDQATEGHFQAWKPNWICFADFKLT